MQLPSPNDDGTEIKQPPLTKANTFSPLDIIIYNWIFYGYKQVFEYCANRLVKAKNHSCDTDNPLYLPRPI